MEYEKGYVYKLMDEGCPTDNREPYFKDAVVEMMRARKLCVNGQNAEITFTSVLNANVYGARGTYRMKGTHHYELRSGEWIAVNG